MRRAAALLILYTALSAALLVALGTRALGVPPLGTLLDPLDGLYRTARNADAPPPADVEITGLRQAVRIEWDRRGVPHIFAENDLDAVRATGYVVARDRLFQLDFLPRAASGRLAAALGPAAVPADRFLRRTGMDWGAKKNLDRIREEEGAELELLTAFADGVNSFVSALDPRDLPFEFRLLGYEPDPWTPLQTLRLLQYMNYDLSYRTDEPSYAFMRERLSAEDFELLYPRLDGIYVPIIPPGSQPSTEPSRPDEEAERSPLPRSATSGGAHPEEAEQALPVEPSPSALSAGAIPGSMARARTERPSRIRTAVTKRTSEAVRRLPPYLEGFIHGKGSNNWAVGPQRSESGHPVLAGDMHLSVTLPSIWYEIHLVTPSMNTYGVTIPGAPLPVEAFNDRVAWAFTNTGSDQIDHYDLGMDPTGTRYRYDGAWHALEVVLDTIFVNGEEPIVDTLRYAHWGPVIEDGGGRVAIQWTAHKPSRTLAALHGMNAATDRHTFDEALRNWDTPMQNIIFADVEGDISIRSTGLLPVRRGGHGSDLLDGSSRDGEWIGRVPFEELPHSYNPPQGFLTSTNQRPTDSTYAYYIGADWRDQYRSLRIDTLLRGKARHSADDIARYQSDVYAVQHDLFFSLIDSLTGLSPAAAEVRDALGAWDGVMSVDREEPLLLHLFLGELYRLAWDEPEFRTAEIDDWGDSLRTPVTMPMPSESRLFMLLRDRPDLRWFDIADTPQIEDAAALLRSALDAAAERLAVMAGDEPRVPRAGIEPGTAPAGNEPRSAPAGNEPRGARADEQGGAGSENDQPLRWGRHRQIVFRHLIGSSAFAPFGRGPFEYPGYRETLSPAGNPLSTHSASWRVVVDFDGEDPRGRGVYPGGQSGNPFSRLYDSHVQKYLAFEYYDLLKPSQPGELEAEQLRAVTVANPAEIRD